MDLMTKREARERGLPTYFDGKPCKRGHISPHRSYNGRCIECHRIQNRVKKPKDFRPIPKRPRKRPDTSLPHPKFLKMFYMKPIGKDKLMARR